MKHDQTGTLPVTNTPETPSPVSSSIVRQYERISELSERLLELAITKQWDDLSELTEHYSRAVRALQPMGTPDIIDAERCRELIQHILHNDTRLRELIEPERNRLNLEMGNLKRQTTVLTAYSAPVLTHER